MWFRFTSDFLQRPFTRHIREKCAKRSPVVNSHILEAIQLIASSLSYPVTERNTSSAVAWQVLVEDGILREVDGGYSAIEWLTEEGLFAQKKPRFARKAADVPQKTFVRSNVSFTEGELTSLRERTDAATLETAFDMLSEYKTKSGKEYNSDYRAMLAWALGAAAKPESKKDTSKDIFTDKTEW